MLLVFKYVVPHCGTNQECGINQGNTVVCIRVFSREISYIHSKLLCHINEVVELSDKFHTLFETGENHHIIEQLWIVKLYIRLERFHCM